MYSRAERIDNIDRPDFLRKEIVRCATVGNVVTNINIVDQHGSRVSLLVEVYADNQGSVDDFCESLLRRIASEDRGDSHVVLIADTYVQRVEAWLVSQQK